MKKALYIIILYLLSSGLQQPALAQKSLDPDYILLLNSANFGEAWSDVILESLTQGVYEQGIEVKTDVLLVPVMKTMEHVQAKRQMLLAKYPTPPRAVIFIGDPGWLVLRPLFDNEWKDVPTLICYSRDLMPTKTEDLLCGNLNSSTMRPSKEVTQGYNLTVLHQPPYIYKTIETMQRILPDMQRIAFISDHRYISMRERDAVAKVVRESFPQLQFESLSTPEMSTEELFNRLEQCDETVGIIYYSWFVTENKTQHSYLDDNVQKILFSFSRTPIFTLADRKHDTGSFAGGYYILASDFAQEVISTVDQILSGTPARDIPWRDGGAPALYLNYAHLEHHNVPPALFPQDAIYSQAPPGFVEKYKFQLVVIIAVLLLIFIGGVMWLWLFLQRQIQLRREYHLSAQYRQLVDNMPVIYIRKQQHEKSDDFIFLDVNASFEHTFGCSRDQVAGKCLSVLKSSFPQLGCISEDLDTDAFTLVSNDGEHYFHRLVFTSSDPGVQDIFCIDRTEEYQARLRMDKHHQELQKLYEKYRLVLRATGLTPWTWNKHTKLIDCDFEYTPGGSQNLENNQLIITEEIYYDLIHPDDRARIRQAYADLHEGRTDIFQQEYRVIYSPGDPTYHWANSFAVVNIWDEARKPLLLVGASLQIDKQKALEQDLRESKEKAEESNRLKSAFLANMSHEIRTPLNAIVGFSSLLLETKNPDEQNQYMNIVLENNDLLLKLVSDILDLSRIESGSFEIHNKPFNANQMCQELVRSLRIKITKKPVELLLAAQLPECMITGDKIRLIQVLSNFINNAIKFTHKGSIILGYQLNGTEVRFYVQDTGVGIPTDDLPTVFGRFVKLDTFAQGTGLGLSICKLLIEQMGGQIGVESTEGQGSCFWFTVPQI